MDFFSFSMPVVVKQVQVVKTVRKTVAKEVYVPPKRVKITIGKVKPKLPWSSTQIRDVLL